MSESELRAVFAAINARNEKPSLFHLHLLAKLGIIEAGPLAPA